MTSADTLRMHLLILNTDRSDGGLMLQFSPIQTVHNFRARALNFIGAAAHAHAHARTRHVVVDTGARAVRAAQPSLLAHSHLQQTPRSLCKLRYKYAHLYPPNAPKLMITACWEIWHPKA